MNSLQGPVVCPLVCGKRTGMVNSSIVKATMLRSELCGFNGISSRPVNVARLPRSRVSKLIGCSFSSSSNDNGSMAENFNESDADYVNSSVVEAVEVRSGKDGFMIKMRDGRHVKCVQNNPQGVHLPDYASNPAIVLKIEDGTGLLLPIIVLEMSSVLLMAAIRNVQLVQIFAPFQARPTMYQVLKEMVEKMGYAVKLVRVTKRVDEAYIAQLYLTKLDNDAESISFDLRPSDAINIAVKCKVRWLELITSSKLLTVMTRYCSRVLHVAGNFYVPIQVNKNLVYSDGMRIVEFANPAPPTATSNGLLFHGLDNSDYHYGFRPTGQPSIDEKEFVLVRNMLVAAVEERYRDAALWRDKLTQLRSNKNWT
ncbi:bifunctional nuclease 1-like isoform X2 [Lycium ferocissimum]|uniref:bifunctional nuclease 1-like isoform X2 n=1 Tax=Lycium ferocissimum TaxID=112874 RepID=UPI00281505A3|nr:bifunctional nuclease 1-like isoform X2 [Lycium ferocissimum]